MNIKNIKYLRSDMIMAEKTLTSSKNNLILFMFIRFPAILLFKTIDSYLHELCTGYFT